MSSPQDAADIMHRYFDEASGEKLRHDLDRVAPGLANSVQKRQAEPDQLTLLQPVRAALPLKAYLASALTGLADAERHLVFQLSDIIAVQCREYGIELYEPRKRTDPVHHADAPAEHVFRIDREGVLSSDVLIHLAHYPSTGAGEELHLAQSALLPVILISHGENRVSRMVSGLPGLKIELKYTEPEDLWAQLREALARVRPVLEERKLAFADYDRNIIGEKIRLLRESQGLTRSDLAGAVGEWMTIDVLARIEECSDRVSNPTLLELRQIAAALSTTVAELVAPDLGELGVATCSGLGVEA